MRAERLWQPFISLPMLTASSPSLVGAVMIGLGLVLVVLFAYFSKRPKYYRLLALQDDERCQWINLRAESLSFNMLSWLLFALVVTGAGLGNTIPPELQAAALLIFIHLFRWGAMAFLAQRS